MTAQEKLSWTTHARLRLNEQTKTMIRRVVDRVAEAHTNLISLVPTITIECDFATEDAGWFRFKGKKALDIIINIANCRTTADVAYVLLHELRHAKQHAVLGWERLADADRHAYRQTHRAWQIEADAAAWGIDEVARLRLRRRRLLWPHMHRSGQPESMHTLHCSDRPALRLWSEVDE